MSSPERPSGPSSGDEPDWGDVVCEECGGDLCMEGLTRCTDCLEALDRLADSQKKRIAVMLGTIAGLHRAAKELEAEGVDMDMTCCQLEDVFATLEPRLGSSGESESLARNG